MSSTHLRTFAAKKTIKQVTESSGEKCLKKLRRVRICVIGVCGACKAVLLKNPLRKTC
jgi:hypothetical protein